MFLDSSGARQSKAAVGLCLPVHAAVQCQLHLPHLLYEHIPCGIPAEEEHERAVTLAVLSLLDNDHNSPSDFQAHRVNSLDENLTIFNLVMYTYYKWFSIRITKCSYFCVCMYRMCTVCMYYVYIYVYYLSSDLDINFNKN